MDESNASLAYLELEFSLKIYTIRQIKFQIFIEYAIKISKMKIQALSEDLSQILWRTFSQICEKCQIWVLEHHLKMDYVPKFRKNPAKPKLDPQNVLHGTSCSFIWSSRVLEFAIFG